MYYTGQLMTQGASNVRRHSTRQDAELRAKSENLIEVLSNPADVELARKMVG